MKQIKNYDDPYEIGRVVRSEEKAQREWERSCVYPPNASLEACARRVIYGGRKGRSAARRLGLWLHSGRGPLPKYTKYPAYSVLVTKGPKYARAVACYQRQWKEGRSGRSG